MKRLVHFSLLASLLACTACAEQGSKTALADQPMQVSSIRWDELSAANSAAHVTNNNLIMMR